MYKWLWIAGLSLTLYACEGRRVFEEYQVVESSSWSLDDVKRFEVEIENSSADYNLIFNLRNSGTYKYRNLFVFMTRTGPSGELARDTLNLPLADEQGKWYGSGLGDIKELEIMFRYQFRFPQEGTYTFEFQQGMREESLDGIHDIGMRVEYSE
jgi:gliding motility-associated lipoprotein GldH